MNKMALRMTMGLGLLALGAQQVSADSNRNCGPRPAVIAQLSEKFGETRQSIGLGANNAVVETFASDDTGSWTITVTIASGMTCLLASGIAFERLDEFLPVGDPA